MNPRHPRSTPRSVPAINGAPVRHAPQPTPPAVHVVAPVHAPNAALLIDFDNVTMGIRSDLDRELRSLLSSDIIKGKVAVQRAYADWRRYPQYITPLTAASIDLVWAPAYGASKKNATDIRLAIDAMELVFSRPEIGTYILLSGDSDFSSLVIKLKEYGKYVIGVGIRESSSDLLVQNCDEYYSYNALAGLVRSADEEAAAEAIDPWELVSQAVQRMRRNGDVMRADRLKQVMQEIDPNFDEKNVGMSKFSRFCQEAANRGLIILRRLENGQLEVDVPAPERRPSENGRRRGRGERPGRVERVERAEIAEIVAPEAELEPEYEVVEEAEETLEEERGRRGRRGRGRGRDREREERFEPRAERPRHEREERPREERHREERPREERHREERHREERPRRERFERPAERAAAPAPSRERGEEIGAHGERLTRDEAFDLVRRAVDILTSGDEAIPANLVRIEARRLLGRDSESLSERNFPRILRDAHDADVIDLRRRGDEFEVARAEPVESVGQQLERAAAAHEAAEQQREQAAAATAPAPRRGMGPRSAPLRGRAAGRVAPTPPPDLFSVGVVEVAPPARQAPAGAEETEEEAPAPARRPRARRTGTRARTKTAKAAPPAEASEEGEAPAEAPAPKRRSRARKTAARGSEA